MGNVNSHHGSTAVEADASDFCHQQLNGFVVCCVWSVSSQLAPDIWFIPRPGLVALLPAELPAGHGIILAWSCVVMVCFQPKLSALRAVLGFSSGSHTTCGVNFCPGFRVHPNLHFSDAGGISVRL
jgi:hypothetical protein